MDSRKRFSALETMCRERAQLAKREFEYWLAEADEWARYKEFLRSIHRGNSNPTRLVCGTSEHNQKFISKPNMPKHARVCSCGFRVADGTQCVYSIRVGGAALGRSTVKRGSQVSRHVNLPNIAVAVAAASLDGRHGCDLTGYTYLSLEDSGRLN